MSARGVIASAMAVFGAAALVVGCSGQSSDTGQPGTVRLAVTDLEGLEELQREYSAFKDEFEKQSGLEGRVLRGQPPHRGGGRTGQADRVDVVFTGPAEYVVIHAEDGRRADRGDRAR